MNAPILPARNKGFALVVTLSLMILLTVIAVGLLTLSSISLRASGQGEAMATAKANARLALMLALGDLQKTLGPDRAVTATSEILGTATAAPTKPNLTGVWSSWDDFNPNSTTPPDYVLQKTSRFKRWLVSSADPEGPKARDFSATPWSGRTIELVGNGSLGPDAPADKKATAGLVPLAKGGTVQGSYAWHIADESVKARINSYRDPTRNATLADKRALLAGHRPDPSVISPDLEFLPSDVKTADKTAKDNYALARSLSSKLIDLQQVDLLPKAMNGGSADPISKIMPFRNDVTPYSLGVMTDVRNGGLKQDLSSIFEMSDETTVALPPEFAGTVTAPKRLYETILGTSSTGVSDPYWTTLANYYNTFRSIEDPNLNPTLPSPITGPSLTANKVPKTFFPGPVIAKVETVFSILTREVTSSWMGTFQAAEAKNYDYTVNLVFSPIVTLHNPYNVSIKFHKMQVTFNNIPVAFKFTVKRGDTMTSASQSVVDGQFESLNEMIENNSVNPATGEPRRKNKKIVLNIANWKYATVGDLATDGPIVMKPGQTLVCQPYINENATFLNDSHINQENTEFFDFNNILTPRGIKAKPLSQPALGFEINNLLPSQKMGEAITGIKRWFLFLREPMRSNPTTPPHPTDTFFVEYKVQQPKYYVNQVGPGLSTPTDPASFSVEATLESALGSIPINYGKLSFDYSNDTLLKNFFNDRVYRCPPTGELEGSAIFVPATSIIKEQPAMRPIAVFSAYARTTNGGVFETGDRTRSGPDSTLMNILKDGRLAGKPFLFHNPSRSIMAMNLTTSKAGNQPYELNFQPFVSRGDYEKYMSIDQNRVPAITGNTTTRGVMSGSYLEIPSGPLQTIADFRRSNVFASSYMPHFTQPLGNSLLHPLMSSNKAIELTTSISPDPLLDHSILANHSFYDRFYFSTFATRGSEKPPTVFENFINGDVPLATQGFTPFLPEGKTALSAKLDLFSASKPNATAYQRAAEYQMLRGAFNVNSTSVPAWKAVLSALHKSEIAILWAKNGTQESKTSAGVPILGMSLHNGGPVAETIEQGNIDNQRTNDWNGYLNLNPDQLTKLATEIVKQVRLRGPFLSMSEFVNRQIGPQSPLSLTGALEQAIIGSGINDDFLGYKKVGGYVTEISESDLIDPTLYNYKTPAATVGNPAAGAPGWVSQGDLLRILEPAATIRSDTFVVRVCGQAQDKGGNVIARAYAEAVVQRTPEYVDPVDRPSLNACDQTVPTSIVSTASAVNKKFGRRINVVSFRWLSDSEI